MKTFSEFSKLIEQKGPEGPDFRGGRQAGARWAGGQYPKGTNPGTYGGVFTKGSQGEFAKPNVLRMVTTNPMSNTFAQNFLNRAAATKTMMTRTLPGAVLAGSLAGIDLLRQKRAQEKSDAEFNRLRRMIGPTGPQRLRQGDIMPNANKPRALGIPGNPNSPRIGDYVGGK